MPLTAPRLQNPAWIGVALSFYAFIAIGIAEGGLGVLLPSILDAYNLTPATVTLLFLSQVTGYIAAALSSSLLSSRIGLARMLLVASITLTTALLVYALTPYWFVMVSAGTLLGLGIGLIDAGINTYIANDQRNANLMGVLHAFYGIGALLGPALATTLLAYDWGWRQIYFAIATLVGLTVLGMLGAVVFDYKPMAVRMEEAGPSPVESLRLALRTPLVLMAGLLLMLYVGTEAGLGNWAYSVQVISRNTPTWIAGYSVSAYWLGLTCGRFFMGQIVARLGAVRSLDYSFGLLIFGLACWLLFPTQLWSLPLMGLALSTIFPTTIWLTPQRIDTPLVPAAIGFLTSVASLGAATIPTAIGWIAAKVGLGLIPALMLPLAILMLLLHRWLVQKAIAKN